MAVTGWPTTASVPQPLTASPAPSRRSAASGNRLAIETLAPDGAPRPSTPYDPEREQDPLIREYITRNRANGQAVFKPPHGYPVLAIVRNLLAGHWDRGPARQSFPDMPERAFDAAERFYEMHRDDITAELE